MAETEGTDAEELHPHSREVAKGSFWGLAGNILIKLISFVYMILIARAASQSDVGLFYLALSIVTIISVFSDIGISSALQRYIPYFEARNEHGKANGLLNWSYAILTVSGIVLTLVLWWEADFIGSIYHSAALPDAIRLISTYLLLNNLFKLHYTYLQAKADIRASQSVQNLQNFLKLVLTALLFVLYGASVTTMTVAFVLSYLLSLIPSSLIVHKTLGTSRVPAALSHRELLSEVAPIGLLLAVMQSFSIIFASSDQLLLGYLAAPSKAIVMVAIYSLATSLASVLLIFPSSVGNIFLPVVSGLAGKNDMDRMRAVLETAQRWSLFITLPFAITLMSFSADILRVFYGSAYTSGATTMVIYSFGLVLFAVSYMTLLALAALRLVRVEFGVTMAIGVVNILLNILLIPPFGIEGAAVASTAGFAVGLLLLQYYGEKLLGFRFPAEIWRLLAAAVLVFLVLLAADPLVSSLSVLLPASGSGTTQVYLLKSLYLLCLAVLVLLSMLLFMGCALLFKCFRREDVSLMKSVMRRALLPPPLISLAEKMASYGVSGRE
jgi:O-antigen/teichoic acid export membrane protein